MDAVGNVAQQFGVYWPNLIAQVVLFAIVYLGSEAIRIQAGDSHA